MKYCRNCGSQLDDNASFCMNCGAKTEAEAPAEQYAPQPEVQYAYQPEQQYAVQPEPTPYYQDDSYAEMQKNRKVGIIACAAAGGFLLLVIAIVLAFVLSGGGYKKPIDNLIAVTFKGKADKIETLAPDEYWDYYEEEYGVDIRDIIDEYEDEYENELDDLVDLLGEDISVDYEIEDKVKLSNTKVSKIADYLSDKYSIRSNKVKKAYKLEVELTIEGDEDEKTTDMDIYVVQIAGKWYPIEYSSYGGEVKVNFITEF